MADRRWTRALGRAPTVASKSTSREPVTVRLEPIELEALAVESSSPTIRSRALSSTVRMKPVPKQPRLAKGSAPVPVHEPARGPRRPREKLSADQIRTRKTS